MELNKARTIAERVKGELAPHCERIEIAGSIRRRKPEVGDIEIVAIPKPYDIGLFESGIAKVVNQWQKVKGELPCKYTQRILPDGIDLDLFFATKDNWGSVFLIRTGNSNFSKWFVGTVLPQKGYRQRDGHVWKNGEMIPTPEERSMFDLAGIAYIHPNERVR